MKTYFVYVMSNESKMIYIGVTNNLKSRVAQHQQKLVADFTQRYNLHKLVHHETFSDIRVAIAREKELKGWIRKKKVALLHHKIQNGATSRPVGSLLAQSQRRPKTNEDWY